MIAHKSQIGTDNVLEFMQTIRAICHMFESPCGPKQLKVLLVEPSLLVRLDSSAQRLHLGLERDGILHACEMPENKPFAGTHPSKCQEFLLCEQAVTISRVGGGFQHDEMRPGRI